MRQQGDETPASERAERVPACVSPQAVCHRSRHGGFDLPVGHVPIAAQGDSDSAIKTLESSISTKPSGLSRFNPIAAARSKASSVNTSCGVPCIFPWIQACFTGADPSSSGLDIEEESVHRSTAASTTADCDGKAAVPSKPVAMPAQPQPGAPPCESGAQEGTEKALAARERKGGVSRWG